jgi:hypothetical protein
MENLEKIEKSINELLKILGHENLSFTTKPVFFWNGNCITDDETAQIKQVSTYKLNDGLGFNGFLNRNKGKKIVICPHPGGMIINEVNFIRCAVL